MRVQGIDVVIRNMNNYLRNLENATSQALNDVGFDLLQKSKDLAPIDTGDLRASGYVETATVGNLRVVIGFSQKYALFQHENLTFRHTDGQAKYLESPLNTKLNNYIAYIQRKVGGV